MTIMIAPSTIKTVEQLLAASDLGRCELVRGELVMMSPAGANHGDIANNLAYLLTDHVKKHRLGKIFAAETGFMISRNPDTVRAPDVAFVTAARVKNVGQGFFPGAPDLAVEVLSPNDSASEVLDKVNDWLSAGAVEVWIADPQRKTIAVYDKQHAVRVLVEQDHLTCESRPGFRVAVAEIFR
jgi:Uma2 family endonuclease